MSRKAATMRDYNDEDRAWITLDCDNKDYSIVLGSSTEIKLKVQNQGEETDYIEIGVRGIPRSWTTLSPQVVKLAPEEEAEVTLTVQPPPPPETQAGIYSFQVVAISQQNPRRTAQVEIVLRVAVFEAKGRIGVMMETIQFAVAPGSTVTIPILLLNQGLEPDKFKFQVTGIPVNWVSTASPITSLEPGASKGIKLTIHPPQVPESKAGRNPFALRIASDLFPEDYVEVNCILTIAAYTKYRVGLEPKKMEAGAPVQLMVENQGNVVKSFNLTWQNFHRDLVFDAIFPVDQAEHSREEIHPEIQKTESSARTETENISIGDPYILRVQPGKIETVQFQAKPVNKAILGAETSHEYSVEVNLADKSSPEPLQVKGLVTSRAIVPNWVLPVTAVLFVLFGCFIFYMTSQALNRNGSATETATYGTEVAIAATQTSSVTKTATADTGQPPPTQVSPTEPPPTPISPTEPPPTPVPPTEPPPTPVPPTEPPPIQVPPTEPPPTAPPSLPSLPGEIAFSSNRDGNLEIYVQNGANHSLVRLTNHTAVDTQPTWSPNGNRIAFTTNRDGNNEIYIMDANGSNLINISNHPADDQFPTWSPDGGRIAFASNRDGNWEIYSVATDGSDLTNLTNNPADDLHPYWFRSSGLITSEEIILFATNRDGNFEIYRMNRDGTDHVNLSNHPRNDVHPTASSQGRTIAFVSDRDGPRNIFLMGVNGDSPINLSSSGFDDLYPSWSPDDNWIIFASNRGRMDLYIIRPDGTSLTNFSNTPTAEEFPSWR